MKPLHKEYSAKDRQYYAQNRDEMLKYISPDTKSLLDVGCSSGVFGAAVKEHYGSTVWGIEPDEKAAKLAEVLLDRVYNTVFDENLNLNGKKFDCIVFNDVLEHLVNPVAALELCKSYLTDKGIIVCSIPNIRFFDAVYQIIINKDFPQTDSGIFDKTHLRFFTKKSIVRLFTEVDYEIRMVEGINSIKELNIKGYKNFKILNSLLFNAIEDMEYLQYAVVAVAKTH
ncbi:class I SAM-dependent methyltransferase [Fibrivirga algicola]|uniref:Class I SAM-dependent methyltransferase n=1 Tax=Fibrivirga algicola TaxID=2950420 RepID=A0ABX0QL99_9BACT|nr:class I SAM-dependent methyltransferase [Fibrivirga algicola]NID11657.1 class I SAM-dependent methyltransferase [Fibrivirga algicola]